jgi:hypothetical protein
MSIRVLNNTREPIQFAVGVTGSSTDNVAYTALAPWQLTDAIPRSPSGATVYVVKGDLANQNDFKPEIYFIPLNRVLVIT